MCCTSLRGAAYFGASIHITFGAVLFIRYVIATAFLTFFNVTDVSVNTTLANVIKDRITGYLLPFMAYITLFLAFGIVIFHSVEKEYFIILKWATLGFSLLQIVVLVALYILRFLPAYEYRQFPFLPMSVTDGYVTTGFHVTNFTSHSGGSSSRYHLGGEGYSSSEFLPNLTHGPGGVYPTSATTNGSRSTSRHPVSSGAGGADVSRVTLGDPISAAPPNKWLADVYSLIVLIIMTVVSLVYLILLFIYVRQLIYEDSGHVFGHAQSVTRNVAFYVQPQFAQSGNSDNKLTNSPSPALRSKAVHSLQNLHQPNCTQPISNTQIPSEFLPQPQNQPSRQVGNHLKSGTVEQSATQSHKDTTAQYQQHPQAAQMQISQQQNQSQNHIHQRSPVPPAREMQQNIQTQQQQQVITIYPQKGGGFTSSHSSPRMQVKFAKPLEQPNPSGNPMSQSHSHIHGGDPVVLPEPPRSCLANPGNVQQQQHQQCNVAPPVHMMPQNQPQSQCQQRLDSGRNLATMAGGQYQQIHGQPQHPGQLGFPPTPHSHIQGHPGPPYTHQQQQPPQHMSYHGKSRAQQQSYNDMVDNSSYLVFSGNPNSSNLAASPPLHSSHMASASHTYPHCSQRRPSGSMV